MCRFYCSLKIDFFFGLFCHFKMLEILEDLDLKEDNWLISLSNIEKFMERRNYTFQNKITNDIFLYQQNETGSPLFIILVFQEKMGIEHLKNYIGTCEKTIVKDIIFIYQNSITTNCSKIIENMFQFHVELFSLNEFQYDITKLYYYVPHEKITNEKKIREIREIYKNSLPSILRTDPISRYFGFKRSDIIKITRSPTEICYRMVR